MVLKPLSKIVKEEFELNCGKNSLIVSYNYTKPYDSTDIRETVCLDFEKENMKFIFRVENKNYKNIQVLENSSRDNSFYQLFLKLISGKVPKYVGRMLPLEIV